MEGNESNGTNGESDKKEPGIHRDFKLYPAFRRLLLQASWAMTKYGQEGGYLGWLKKQVNNNVDGCFAEILNKISVEYYPVFAA